MNTKAERVSALGGFSFTPQTLVHVLRYHLVPTLPFILAIMAGRLVFSNRVADLVSVLLAILFSVFFQWLSICICEKGHDGFFETLLLGIGLLLSYVLGSWCIFRCVQTAAFLASMAFCFALSSCDALVAVSCLAGYVCWLTRPTRDSFNRRSIREIFDVASSHCHLSRVLTPSQYALKGCGTGDSFLRSLVDRAVRTPVRMAVHAFFSHCLFQATTPRRSLATGSISSALVGMSSFSASGKELILDGADRFDMIADVAFHDYILLRIAVVNVSGRASDPDKVYSVGALGRWLNVSATLMGFAYSQLAEVTRPQNK
jgi:hypothetical protein